MKNTILLICGLLLSCGLSAASASATTPPAWLDDPHSLYPDTMYLCALGEGDTRKDAESDATGNLSRIFESKVSVDETTRERIYELQRDAQTISSDETQVDRNVGVKSSQTLVNVQMGESYCDSRGRYHVVAYLDRLKTGEVYTDKIESASKEIVVWRDKAHANKDAVPRYAFLNAASLLAASNDVLLAQLAIISPSAKEFIDLPYDPVKLRTEIAEAARAVTLTVAVKGDDEGKITVILKDVLVSQGFTVNTPGVLSVSCAVSLEKVDMKGDQGAKFIRWTLGMEMKDVAGNVLVSHYDKGREGHVTESEAEARCYRTVEGKIRNAFVKKLNDYFDGFVK
jgi:hypothetical protein